MNTTDTTWTRFLINETELHLGQKVQIRQAHGPRDEGTIARLTKTQVALEDGRKYMRRTGTRIGGAHYASYISEVSSTRSA